MNHSPRARSPQIPRSAAHLLLILLLAGCGALKTTSTPPPAFYALDRLPREAVVAAVDSKDAAARERAPTLIVNPPHAAAGYDSRRIIYVRAAHQLEYFAHSEWVDTPARMLVPLIVAAIENQGAFRAVVTTPSAAVGDLRLDTEIVRLQQDFSRPPSQVRFTLRADLVDNTTRRVLAQHEFDVSVAAAGDDPRNGVDAANRAVQDVLERLARLCREASERWQSAAETAAAADPAAPAAGR